MLTLVRATIAELVSWNCESCTRLHYLSFSFYVWVGTRQSQMPWTGQAVSRVFCQIRVTWLLRLKHRYPCPMMTKSGCRSYCNHATPVVAPPFQQTGYGQGWHLEALDSVMHSPSHPCAVLRCHKACMRGSEGYSGDASWCMRKVSLC